MKINVTLDLTDVWCDEENNGNLSDVLKEHIVWEVQQAVWAEFSDEAKKDFSSKVRNMLDGSKKGRIDAIVDECFNSEKIRKSPYDSKTEVTMKEYVCQALKHQTVDSYSFNNKLDESVKKQGADIANELKSRYDILFASQLVAKMNENGLLKDDVARLLLDNGNNGG